jgi:replication factor C small subunit
MLRSNKLSTDIWTFKHSPDKLDGMILNESVKGKFKKIIKELPNLLIYSTPGQGKGTFVNILLKETGLDHMIINASDETGIDNLRTKVKSFATSLGSTDIKIVVLNEADALSMGQSGAQKMLRQLMEDVHGITRFILLANYEHLIIPEIKSRCQVIEISNPPAKDIFLHCMKILAAERVEVRNKSAIVSTIKNLYPDIRKIINTIQLNTVDGILDSIAVEKINGVFNIIRESILKGDVDEIRKTLRSNSIDYVELYRYLYDNCDGFKSPGDVIINVGEYMYKDSIVAIKEINFMAMVIKCLKNGYI